jgi:hypothetical protein
MMTKKTKKPAAVAVATAEPAGKGWRGAAQLVPLLMPIASLTLDEENARLHPERNLAALERSLREFGQNKPVVIREGVVFAGNGLVTSAMRLGWTEVAAVDLSHLSKVQARAYGLADNKSGDLSEWDFQRVSEILRDLPENLLDATGFEDFEREPLLQADWTPSPPGTEHGAGPSGKAIPFLATEEQAVIIRKAIAKAREDAGEGPELTDGRALELISADYLAGA